MNAPSETSSTHCTLFERVVRTFVATKAPLACSSNGCCAYTTCVVHTVHCVRPGHEKLNGVTLRILSWLPGWIQCSASVRAQVKTQKRGVQLPHDSAQSGAYCIANLICLPYLPRPSAINYVQLYIYSVFTCTWYKDIDIEHLLKTKNFYKTGNSSTL